MEQSKSPKSLAYARLGKPQSAKGSNNEEQKKGKRNSTGNIYEQILQQIHPEANSYIRELVHKNQKQSAQSTVNNTNFHSRRKSYAEIVIDSSSKEREKAEKVREERETLCKPKFTLDSAFLQQQITPKNSTIPLSKKSSTSKITNSLNQSSNIMINSFKKQADKREQSFLDNLTNYISDLSEAGESYGKHNIGEKLSETLKINYAENDSFKLVSRLEQSHMKIKELKVKQYYQQKQLGKYQRKEQKMKDSLFEMLGEIKHLNAQLTYQKKERKKLQRIIDSFQMRKNQPQRKTIGKHYNLRLQQLNDFNTEHEYEDSSYREYNRNIGNKRTFNPIKIYDQQRNMHGMLDSQKIEKLFRSNYNSDQSDD